MIKISIITSVLNAVGSIKDCVESVRTQNYPAEHIIIDGGSTDGTIQIIEKYRSYLALLVSEPDKGIYDGMNKGIQLATGDVVGLLNADDLYAGTDVLSTVAESFANSGIDTCYGDLVYVDPYDVTKVTRNWKSGNFRERSFYWGWMPPHPTFFVRRSVYEKYSKFNLDLGSAADYELMLRFLVKHHLTTAYIPKVLVKMRAGGASNASLKNRINANRMDRLAWEVNCLKGYPWTTYLKPLRKIRQYFVFG
jgi:glycosyltransferase